MKKVMAIILLSFVFPFALIGCEKSAESTAGSSEGSNDEPLSYEQISGEDAYAIMKSESDYIIIDARTQEEFDQGHIKNAIMIPEYEIEEKAPSLLSDKDQLILVYCRSGRRSKIAAEALVELGYTNVKEFGGIIDWEYETVK